MIRRLDELWQRSGLGGYGQGDGGGGAHPLEEFKAAIAEHGKVRVLIQMRRIPRMGLAAWVEDFKLTPYAKGVERYAIVSDSNLFEWTSKIAEAFIGGEVRRFEDSRYEEAWRWVRS